jgi:hypothetical protein
VLSSIPPSRLVHPGGGGRGTSRHLAVIDLDPYVPTTMVRARTLGALN